MQVFISSKPADVTVPESEPFLATLTSGLWIAHSFMLSNLLKSGSLDKYLCVLSHSFSHIPPTHSTPPSQKHCTKHAVSQLMGHQGTGWPARQFLSLLLGRPLGGIALLSQKQPLLGLRPPGPHLHNCHALPTIEEWQTRWLPLTPWWP